MHVPCGFDLTPRTATSALSTSITSVPSLKVNP
eukprot:CAMPEP_0198219620 /NCGR_PEP_ID=MMETSP1445-20131203/75331_1 /TAXON_ID=36898 /ORGANISM="Pyramimonas sp., Strain CCMP2087" /LENGTH=32 /DNA_ID= /DNA_START= /DNA_END= /DNA_ORIENTATION=